MRGPFSPGHTFGLRRRRRLRESCCTARYRTGEKPAEAPGLPRDDRPAGLLSTAPPSAEGPGGRTGSARDGSTRSREVPWFVLDPDTVGRRLTVEPWHAELVRPQGRPETSRVGRPSSGSGRRASRSIAFAPATPWRSSTSLEELRHRPAGSRGSRLLRWSRAGRTGRSAPSPSQVTGLGAGRPPSSGRHHRHGAGRRARLRMIGQRAIRGMAVQPAMKQQLERTNCAVRERTPRISWSDDRLRTSIGRRSPPARTIGADQLEIAVPWEMATICIVDPHHVQQAVGRSRSARSIPAQEPDVFLITSATRRVAVFRM